MSRKITLKNEQIAQFVRTDDAIKALETSVDNGQIRLSLQILVEIINDLNSALEASPQKESTSNSLAKSSPEVKNTQEKPQAKQKVESANAESENSN